ncbi:MAG: hypothetical protein IKC02_00405 [Oscillospiraceae bacterium]|nr:hypothetical protein [Oscillospiraceae bacterium]
MAYKGKRYEDDDGRTIVDMSGVERPSMFGHLPKRENPVFSKPKEKPERPWEDSGYNRSERRSAVLGALSASLLIGLAYIVGLGALVAFLLYVLW